MKQHAEIAGGGIGGLGLGMMLARRGWSVRIHERSPQIREVGASVSLKNNCLAVLERYDLFAKLEPLGTKMKQALILDRDGRVMQRRDLVGQSRVYSFPRQAVVDVLAEAARDAGAEIVTNSHIVAAEPSGILLDAAGKQYPADLVVAADGVRSLVRDSLGLNARVHELETLVNRYLVDTRSFTPEEVMADHWSGHRRIGIMPSGQHRSFAFVVMSRRDLEGAKMPLNLTTWKKSHPRLSEALDVLGQAEGFQSRYSLVHCPRWSRGRAAIVGDAAHGMPPTLGQGAGLTMMNCHALAEFVSNFKDVTQALQEWEKTVRFISDATARWAVRYERFVHQLPGALGVFLRPSIVWAFGRFRFLNERMRIADKGLAVTGVRIS